MNFQNVPVVNLKAKENTTDCVGTQQTTPTLIPEQKLAS